jgi:choline kinase
MRTKHITSTRSLKKSNKNYSNNLQQDKITIILLYNNDGYRMKSYGPLPLLSISDKKLIDIQLSTIQKHFNNAEILVCVNGYSDKIYKYIKTYYYHLNIRIIENQLFENTNSCESIRLCLNNTMNSKVLICSGDLILNDSLSLIDKNKTCILIESDPCDNLDIGVNIDEKNQAQHFSFGANRLWSEILFLQNENDLDSIKKIITSKNSNKNKFLFEILNEFIKNKNNISCILNKQQIKKINNIKTYHQLKDNI